MTEHQPEKWWEIPDNQPSSNFWAVTAFVLVLAFMAVVIRFGFISGAFE